MSVSATRPARRAFACLLLALTVGAAACGKRGAPLAPIRPLPGPATQLSARRVGDRVEIHFNVPVDNSDASTPPVVGRVEIYGVQGPPILAPVTPVSIPVAPFAIPVNNLPVLLTTSTALVISRFPPVQLSEPTGLVKAIRTGKLPPPVPTAALGIADKKYLRGAVQVRPAPEPPKDGAPVVEAEPPPVAPTPEDPRPQPGWSTTFTEQISAERARGLQGSEQSIMRYVVVPWSRSNRRGPPSGVLELPLGVELVKPANLRAAYDANVFTLTWTPGAPAQTFRVYRSDGSGREESASINPAPLSAATLVSPVEFDKEQCFTVRAVLVRGQASTESEAAGPLCLTPLDTFPPPAPAGLSALPSERQVQLLWRPVTALDLAGYLVLRAENGAAPRALMTEPITDTSFADTTIRPGVRYTYVVVAVDKAGNRSLASNQVDEIR